MQTIVGAKTLAVLDSLFVEVRMNFALVFGVGVAADLLAAEAAVEAHAIAYQRVEVDFVFFEDPAAEVCFGIDRPKHRAEQEGLVSEWLAAAEYAPARASVKVFPGWFSLLKPPRPENGISVASPLVVLEDSKEAYAPRLKRAQSKNDRHCGLHLFSSDFLQEQPHVAGGALRSHCGLQQAVVLNC